VSVGNGGAAGADYDDAMAPRRPTLSFGTVASHFGVLIAVSVVMGVLAAGVAIPVVAAIGYGTHHVSTSLDDLPLTTKNEPLAQRTRVLDASGRTIATFFDQNRVDVPMSQIAPIMRKAIVAIEDDRFYEHGALDLKGTLRAFLTNQADDGTTQGGSSITQQLAKMTEVENASTAAARKAATADTYTRKIREARIAIALQQHYSKDWILNRYLNIAYFGDGAYGIESAAEHYFHVKASKLTTIQASLLAGLVKNPVGYDPTNYATRAKARRNVVLARMAQLGVIPQAKADKLGAQGLQLDVRRNPNGCVGSTSPLYCEYVYRYLLADPALGRSQADREQLINEGGLTIKTTMRPAFQTAAAHAARDTVYPTDQAVGSLAMIQPGTGNVLGIAQSRPVGRNKAKGQTFLNYAVNTEYGDAAGFQPGSSFKLFTLSSALTQGLPPTTSFYSPNQADIPQNEFRTCSGAYQNYATYTVHNSTGFGERNMITGMQQSVNTFFVQLERQTGLCLPYKLANEMGMQLTDKATEQVPSFTLGVASESPLQMAAAYATVAAGGVYCAPHPVAAIYNSAGKVFKTYPLDCNKVLSANVAAQVNSILKGVMSPSGFGAALQLDKPSAGKTGTSQTNVSVWFNGYTPTVATSAVVSGVNSQGHPISLNPLPLHGVYHGTAHGSTVAGPMWALAMRAIEDIIPNRDFDAEQPGPDQSGVPSVKGQSLDEAKATIRSAGFTPQVAGEIDSSYTAGSVAAASLGVDADTVYLYLSTGHGGFSAPAAHHRHRRGGGGGNKGGNGGGPAH
jgi:membrane peptidoglycan carboxypeptidase